MSSLNNKYTFERFVIGPCNQFAHAASIAIANQPAKNYNPLFIYSDHGLGKTHLLHAVGLLTASTHPGLNILYVSAEEFVDEMINSIRYDQMPKFRKKLRNIDCLLIDDIHVLDGQQSAQHELFLIFKKLCNEGKQIGLTSNKYSKDLANWGKILRSCSEWTLFADIQPPDIGIKINIIKNYLQEHKFSISDDIVHYIASYVKSSIRELKHILIFINAYLSSTEKEINLDLVKEVLNQITTKERMIMNSEK